MPIITISRGKFSGGRELAECVAGQLGYRIISSEELAQAASQYGVPSEKLEHALLERPGLRERMSLQTIHLMAYIQAALCREARGDNIVYHGYAGHLLLQGVPHVIHVRVMANMEFRVRKAMENDKLDERSATRLIEKRDSERAMWTRFLYNQYWLDPILYDLIINYDYITPETGCEIVCLAARQPQFQLTPEAERIFINLTLASEVRARIATEGRGRDRNVKVSARDGTVTLSGTTSSMEDADLIKQIASRVDDVKEVRSMMRVHTNW